MEASTVISSGGSAGFGPVVWSSKKGPSTNGQHIAAAGAKAESEAESILVETAGTLQQKAIPLDKVNAGQLQAFGNAMRTKLLDRKMASRSNTCACL